MEPPRAATARVVKKRRKDSHWNLAGQGLAWMPVARPRALLLPERRFPTRGQRGLLSPGRDTVAAPMQTPVFRQM